MKWKVEMHKTKHLGLNITDIEDDKLQKFSFKTDLGDNFEAIDEETLTHRNITNCLLEVPQDIKLELVDGVLTLKAGSKVYIPNGLGENNNKIFDEFILDRDFTFPMANANGTYFVFINKNFISRLSNTNYSGDTQPTTSSTYSVWYDTANNLVKTSNDGGLTWSNNSWSLPLCITTVTQANVAFNSINQVFNGFGYIGSTIFALPGVKGLIPNGRNKDKSLHNLEFTTNNILIETRNITGSGTLVLNANTFSNYAYLQYDKEKNHNMDFNNIIVYLLNVGSWDTDSNGVITSFTPKTPFHAVDFNDYHSKITELETKIQALRDAITALQG